MDEELYQSCMEVLDNIEGQVAEAEVAASIDDDGDGTLAPSAAKRVFIALRGLRHLLEQVLDELRESDAEARAVRKRTEELYARARKLIEEEEVS